MTTFDQLSDEDRAVVELVLQQGRTYEDLADLLGIPESRVRERVHGALVQLSPVTVRGVEEDWRRQLADYVLGQQVEPELTETRRHLGRSEAARSWMRSLLDSLEQLYGDEDMPLIPDARATSRRNALVTRREQRQRRVQLGPVERRLLTFGVIALAAVVGVAVLVWPLGALTAGDSGHDGGGERASARASSADSGEQQGSARRQGAATIARQRGKTQIYIQATGLTPSTNSSGYAVWLYNSSSDRRSLGATSTDQQGNLQVMGNLPAKYRRWRYVDVTSVTATGQAGSQNYETGRSLLRGRVRMAKRPTRTGTGKNKATVLAQISLRPPR